MKRRGFLYATSGLITGYITSNHVAAAAASQDSVSIQPSRSSRLFAAQPPTSASIVPGTQVQDLVVANQQLIVLYRNSVAKTSCLVATDRSGTPLWSQTLPKGQYLGIGIRSQGSTVILHAMSYKKSPNCIIEFNPQTSTLSVVGQATPGSPLHFAGDSQMARPNAKGAIELWDLTVSPTNNFSIALPFAQLDRLPLIEVLPNGNLAVFSHYSQQIGLVDKTTSLGATHQLSSPAIGASVEYYKKYQGTSSVPISISASGFDRSGRLSLIVSPYFKNVATLLAVDQASGAVVAETALQLPPRGAGTSGIPCRIVGNSAETGLVFSDGSVAWYEV